MKKLRVLSAIVVMILITGFTALNAQTFHEDIRFEFDCPVMCLNKVLSGYFVYHVAYHVDQQTGEVTRIHWNVKDSKMTDEDGNVYKVIDTGNDHSGGPMIAFGISSYDMWNTIVSGNEAAIEYYNSIYGEDFWMNIFDSNGDPLEDGWIESALPMGVYAGTIINSFKIIGKKGEKVSFKLMVKYHIDDNGDLVLDFDRTTFDCN